MDDQIKILDNILEELAPSTPKESEKSDRSRNSPDVVEDNDSRKSSLDEFPEIKERSDDEASSVNDEKV